MLSILLILAHLFALINSDYLYMSCHSHSNLIVYSASNSTLITKKLLNTSQIDWISSSELNFRGLDIHNNILYVANSKKDASFIGEWQCNQNQETTDQLQFIANFTGLDKSNPGLVHPYGIRWYHNQNNNLFVTTQDTQSLLLYNSDGTPNQLTPSNNIYPGSIATYGPYSTNGNGVRDVAIDSINNLVFVAEETLQMVLCYDIANNYKNIFNISYGNKAQPIGLRINSKYYQNIIFIGDNGYDSIYAFRYNKTGYNMLYKTKSISELSHPAGIDVNGEYLFVVAQKNNLILQFEARTGNYVRKFVDFNKLDVIGENLMYVEGNGCSN